MSDEALKVFFDGADYVVARDAEHATRVLDNHIGRDASYEARIRRGAPAWQAISPDEPIAIEVDLTLGGREFETMRIGKTAAQWCKAYGVGFLCSTEA